MRLFKFKKSKVSAQSPVQEDNPSVEQATEIRVPQSLLRFLLVATKNHCETYAKGRELVCGSLSIKISNNGEAKEATMTTQYGAYRIVPYPDTNICDTSIESVKEQRTIEVEVAKEVHRYMKRSF